MARRKCSAAFSYTNFFLLLKSNAINFLLHFISSLMSMTNIKVLFLMLFSSQTPTWRLKKALYLHFYDVIFITCYNNMITTFRVNHYCMKYTQLFIRIVSNFTWSSRFLSIETQKWMEKTACYSCYMALSLALWFL